MKQASSIYLTHYAGPVLNQGSTSACYSYAVAANMALFMGMAGVELPELSPMFLYAKTRNLQNTLEQDAGSVPWVGMLSASTYGIPPASEWSNDASNLYAWPGAAVNEIAYQLRVAHSTDYGTEFATPAALTWTIKEALSHGTAVLLTYQANEWLRDERGPLASQVNAHMAGLNSDAPIGFHAVLVVGADDGLNGGSYVVQNSWGAGWGDNGFGTIRYDQLTSADIMAVQTIDQIMVGDTLYDNLWTAETLAVSKLYNAILDRAPEHSGLTFWADSLKAGTSLASLADCLLNSHEYADLLPGDETDAQTAQFFDRTLSANADYVGGSKSAFVIGMLATMADDARIENRADASQFYAMAMRGDGSMAHEVLLGVTDDPQSVQVVLVGLHAAMGE